MNMQGNLEVIHNLSTGHAIPFAARIPIKAPRVYRNSYGDWVGETQWLFEDCPKIGTAGPSWIIELTTVKGVDITRKTTGSPIMNCWRAKSVSTDGRMAHFAPFSDFSLRELAHNNAGRATEKTIAEAHLIAVRDFYRVHAAALAFYETKIKD